MQWITSLVTFLVMANGYSAAAKPTAAQLVRWEGSTNCSGNGTVLSTEKMDECTTYIIPAPASVRVAYLNETAYASYHYQGVTDCSGEGKLVTTITVNSCTSDDGDSQKRVWVEAPAPPPGACGQPGDCGRAYQACCLASQLKGSPCGCKLRNGTGEAGSPDCGFCGKAFVTCCAGFKLTGSPCSCDVADATSAAAIVV